MSLHLQVVPKSLNHETCLLENYSRDAFVWSPMRVTAAQLAPAGAFISMRETKDNPFKVWYSWDVLIKPTFETKRGSWFCSIIMPMDKRDDEYLLCHMEEVESK